MNFVKFKRPQPVNHFTSAIDELLTKGISELTQTNSSTSRPAVNILEMDEAYQIQLAAPGLKKSDFAISIDKDQLIVKVAQLKNEDKAENEKNEDKCATKYTRREFNYQSFTRSFHLPKTVNRDEIKAEYLDGILNIGLTKKEEAMEKEPKVITIS